MIIAAVCTLCLSVTEKPVHAFIDVAAPLTWYSNNMVDSPYQFNRSQSPFLARTTIPTPNSI